MTKWEYESHYNLSDDQADALGKDGWELCGLAQDSDGDLKWVFKRPRISK